MKLYSFEKSEQMLELAKQVFPGGVQASRFQLIYGSSPVYITKGKGSHCWDVDGNEFIDFILSFGPIILGYAYPKVNQAVKRQLEEGVLLTFNPPLQNQLLKKLIEIIPCAEMATLHKTGSEATSASIRIARAFTGKNKVAMCGYHGWHDWCVRGGGTTTVPWERPPIEKTSQVPGVPPSIKQDIYEYDANDLTSLERILVENKDEIAAVIIAPEEIVLSPLKQTLQEIKQMTHQHEVVLIFDEIKTGFRISLGGVQEYLGVIPDLTTVSKGMANGFPIAAVVGKKEIMEAFTKTAISGTFNPETIAIIAALTTIEELETFQGPQHFWSLGEKLITGLNNLAENMKIEAEATGWPLAPMPFLRFKYEDLKLREAIRRDFFTRVIRKGILLHPAHNWFISLSHTEKDVEHTLTTCEEALTVAKQAHVKK
ncbi:aminotransferase class III-fold pyridoxal phosphate-dependent enzyme [Candidatus Aerophobetes bacterium]|uniref:Aminotransferase class III-fold pyridoxal phosphate-dependent enzyme n=2 Tax=root TaxID=1 RepID=A0A523RVL3_UNCAE|nr:MAG: aminotransferase class III-fold pyridoxal phosphate-dependent enzyme [Candidatus Aerophobetes bacterium]